jgi:hypothetical protein
MWCWHKAEEELFVRWYWSSLLPMEGPYALLAAVGEDVANTNCHDGDGNHPPHMESNTDEAAEEVGAQHRHQWPRLTLCARRATRRCVETLPIWFWCTPFLSLSLW